ncbi:hypothetical protein ASF70_13090 [Rhizobium sp. Leaf321]|uniref:hypothetical protein n=1 Tax=Rhizobium sp. Leaf321 TaxID=1736335 RepID=UPI00071296D9|nr:hypothetical protein [Rhizobium sp. Leaf321]KQQ72456.1 hypothetical protein ASF70_13090 [Rhizobium sp. Leaf321]
MREDIPRLKLDNLRERWPGIFEQARYVDVGVGWLPLIEDFLASGVSTVVELKEKFGGLRIDCFDDEPHQQLAKVLAEERSLWRCEVCGEPGFVRRPPSPTFAWWACRCDSHATSDQLAWPQHPSVDRLRLRHVGDGWFRYDLETDALVEAEPLERWKDSE